jgi:hypothetical protein
MGLALVEFVMQVEETFGVTVRDEDAERTYTPNDLVDYIQRLLPPSRGEGCPTQRAFHAVRRAGRMMLGQPRSRFRPRARWADLIRSRERPWRWRALGRALDAPTWPPLHAIRRFPPGFETVGDTARWLMLERPDRFPPAGSSREMIRARIAQILAADFGIARFPWDGSFINDLGLD